MNLTLWRSCLAFCLLSICSLVPAADIKRIVAEDSYLMAYSRRNSERDYQREYYSDVWGTVKDSKIIEKVIAIATSQMDQNSVDQAKALMAQFQEATAPIDIEAMMNASESVYGQKMTFDGFPMPQHIFGCTVTAEAASGMIDGGENLFEMMAQASGGTLAVDRSEVDGATILTLVVPTPSPFQPTIVSIENHLVFTTSRELAMDALKLLGDDSLPCMFDDERLQAELKNMPAVEDGLTFYDAKEAMKQVGDLIAYLRSFGAEAGMAADVVDDILAQFAYTDYAVTVEYTEGHRNMSITHGRRLEGYKDLAGFKMLSNGEPFENWSRWVPSDATSYSIGTGVNLHAFYEWIVPYAIQKSPQVAVMMAQADAAQDAAGINIDKDLLQAFSGEHVLVSMPSSAVSAFGQTSDTAIFLRCRKPERTQELLDQMVQLLMQIPELQQQQVKISQSAELEGFYQISATALQMAGVSPVFGIDNGWMVIGSSVSAVKRIQDTKAGKSDSIASSDGFKAFEMVPEGPVQGVSYANLAENTRAAADGIAQMGTMLPGLLAMGGAPTNDPGMKAAMDMLGLMPTVARIVKKFDFLEAQLSVTQDGSEPGTYVRKAVILVRPPAAAN